MKKLLDKVKEVLTSKYFWDTVLLFAYIFWFGFVGRFIIKSDLNIFVKIIMLIGDVWWAFYIFILHYNSNKE
jgi:hypothetical protein